MGEGRRGDLRAPARQYRSTRRSAVIEQLRLLGDGFGARILQATPIDRTALKLEVRGRDPAGLLDMQHALLQLDGVARVSLHAVDQRQGRLLVELGPDS